MIVPWSGLSYPVTYNRDEIFSQIEAGLHYFDWIQGFSNPLIMLRFIYSMF